MSYQFWSDILFYMDCCSWVHSAFRSKADDTAFNTGPLRTIKDIGYIGNSKQTTKIKNQTNQPNKKKYNSNN